MIVNIYLASSIRGIRRQSGVVAYILQVDGTEKTLTQFGRVEGVTENESYLKALKYALRRMQCKCELIIYADSEHMAAVVNNDWLAAWKEKGWETAKGKTVANKEDWQEIAERLGEKPLVKTKENHPFRGWMETEVERRKGKCLKNSESLIRRKS